MKGLDMDEMEKKVHLKLLQDIMDQMDDASMGKMKKKMEPMVAVEKVESKAMPISDLKEKLMGKKEESESPDMMAMEMDMDDSEEEEEDMDDMSPFMQKMMELKKAKKLGKI